MEACSYMCMLVCTCVRMTCRHVRTCVHMTCRHVHTCVRITCRYVRTCVRMTCRHVRTCVRMICRHVCTCVRMTWRHVRTCVRMTCRHIRTCVRMTCRHVRTCYEITCTHVYIHMCMFVHVYACVLTPHTGLVLMGSPLLWGLMMRVLTSTPLLTWPGWAIAGEYPVTSHTSTGHRTASTCRSVTRGCGLERVWVLSYSKGCGLERVWWLLSYSKGERVWLLIQRGVVTLLFKRVQSVVALDFLFKGVWFGERGDD